MGARAVDCLGLRGPLPTQVHIVGNGLVMYSWKDFFTNKETTKMFNSAGRYLGPVLPPKNTSHNSTRCENLVPIKQDYSAQYYLMSRKKGMVMENNNRVDESEICVTKLI